MASFKAQRQLMGADSDTDNDDRDDQEDENNGQLEEGSGYVQDQNSDEKDVVDGATAKNRMPDHNVQRRLKWPPVPALRV